MAKLSISGAITALVTPFRNGDLDAARLREQIDFQIESGIDGIVPCGTTGESPTLEFEEHERMIDLAVQYAAGRTMVIAGVGANATNEALRLHRHARGAGATAGLSVNPYYNKPSQEGLYRHFMTLADGVDLPIVLYNIPGRTGVTMAPATVARLARHPNIVAIKEATGSVDIATEIRSLCDLTVLSGDDSLTVPLMAIGATGVVSVLSNLMPATVKKLCVLAGEGRREEAARLHVSLFPLIKALFADGNPVGVKAAMAMVGMDSGELRLPLVPASDAVRAMLAEQVERAGVSRPRRAVPAA